MSQLSLIVSFVAGASVIVLLGYVTPLGRDMYISRRTYNKTMTQRYFSGISADAQATSIPDPTDSIIRLQKNTLSPPAQAVFRVQRNDTYAGGSGLGQAFWTACNAGDANHRGQIGIIFCDLSTIDNWSSNVKNNMVAKYNQAFREVGAASTWAGVDEVRRYGKDPVGSTVGREIDIFGYLSDVNGSSVGLDIVGGSIPGMSNNPSPSFGYGLRVGAQYGVSSNAGFAYGVFFNPAIYGSLVSIKAGSSFKDGVDLSAASCGETAFKSAGFQVDCDGKVKAREYVERLMTPASSDAPCTSGQFSDDVDFHYVCVATNKWKRVGLNPF